MEISELALLGSVAGQLVIFSFTCTQKWVTLKRRQSRRCAVFDISGFAQSALWQQLCRQPWEQPTCHGSLGPPEWCQDCDPGLGSFITKGPAEGWAGIKPHLLHRICKYARIRASLPLYQDSWNFMRWLSRLWLDEALNTPHRTNWWVNTTQDGTLNSMNLPSRKQ